MFVVVIDPGLVEEVPSFQREVDLTKADIFEAMWQAALDLPMITKATVFRADREAMLRMETQASGGECYFVPLPDGADVPQTSYRKIPIEIIEPA